MNYFDKLSGKLREYLPDADIRFIRVYTLLILVKGEDTTMEDVHDAWSFVITPQNPEHRSLIPFDDLSTEVQEYDRKYMEIIHEVAREAKIERS